MEKQELITPSQAARMLCVPYSTVTQLCREGSIPAVKTGRRWLINRRKLCRMYGLKA